MTRRSSHCSANPFRTWFRRRVGRPTLPQCGAVPSIKKGENVLVASPTGTGRTLSFFTAILDELFELARRDALPDGIHTLYISPIRALGYDIRKNLTTPLEEVALLDATPRTSASACDRATPRRRSDAIRRARRGICSSRRRRAWRCSSRSRTISASSARSAMSSSTRSTACSTASAARIWH
jgi:Lhr-like helicase